MKVTSKRLFKDELGRINMTFSTVSYAELDSSWNCRKMQAPFTRIYLIDSGEARIICNNEVIPLIPGNAYILPAGLDFESECNGRMTKIFFHISILRYNKYDMLNGCHKCIVLKDKRELIEKIKKLLEEESVNSVLMIKSNILSLVAQGIEQEGIDLGDIEEYSATVKTAIKIVESDLKASLKVSEIAEKLYISESRLQKEFKKEVGVPIGKYIDDRLMLRAESMLREKSHTVKEISDILGFCDQFYFTRKFTKRFGSSPSSYKKKLYT